MTLVCWALRMSPLYMSGTGRRVWLAQLLLMLPVAWLEQAVAQLFR